MGNITDHIKHKIYFICGHRVMLDRELAELYEVETSSLNRAVRRNMNNFPDDFMFQLTQKEVNALCRQLGSLEGSRGQNIKYLPFVFTEQGVAMLSSVLKSDCAVRVNIEIMRAFVQLRQFSLETTEIEKRLNELEWKYTEHDEKFTDVFEAIRRIINSPMPSPRKVGFKW